MSWPTASTGTRSPTTASTSPTWKPGAAARACAGTWAGRSEEHTSELQSLMRISYAVFCLKKKRTYNETIAYYEHQTRNELKKKHLQSRIISTTTKQSTENKKKIK